MARKTENLREVVDQLSWVKDQERDLEGKRLSALRRLQADFIARWLEGNVQRRRWNAVPPPLG